MALIDSSYFFGPLLIPQKSDAAISSSLTALIDELEDKLLTDLLGYDLYKDYKAGIAVDPLPSDSIWKAIRDGKEYTNRQGVSTKWLGLKYDAGTKKSLLANYVYWHWMQQNVTVTTGSGEKSPKNTTAENASPGLKMQTAWNEMVNMICDLVEFLLTNVTDYPKFQDHYNRIPYSLLKKQNLFGI